MSDKYDSFQPRRATSVDGFLSGPGQRPRQPHFHAPEEETVRSPAGSQKSHLGFSDMQRPQPPPARLEPEEKVRAESTLPDVPVADSLPETTELPHSRRRTSVVDQPVHRPKKSRHILKRALKILGIFLLAAILIFGFKFYKNIAKVTGHKNPFSLIGIFRPTELKNDYGRVNILVAGNSADDLGHDGGELTDSIMLLSINIKNNTAMMLSIPRDLWVQIPGDSHTKINAAYPFGGMNALKQTVEDVTGLNVHYTALVNYTAFRDLVNAVGGITINIQSSDKRGIYDSNLDYTSRTCCALAKYPNGPVALDGKQALNLARARGDPNPYGYTYGFDDGDYTRTLHQRQMLLAIKEKMVQPSVVANPFKISSIVDAVGKNVKTDLQLSEMQTLFYYGKKIDNSKIDSYNIDTLGGKNTHMLTSDMISGQSVQVPAAGVDDYTDIQDKIKKVFTAGPLVKEDAGVVILNGTDGVGLAKQQKSKLTAKGASVLATGNAVAQPTTTLVDNSEGKMPSTLAYLKSTYNAKVITDTTLTANWPGADFILILGESALPKTQTTTQ